ncbi:MAG TPA: hypothetical protein V6C76_08630 [Drouetiella sp.]
MDKVAAFCIGNAVGLSVLFGGILISESRKMKEAESLKRAAVANASASKAQSETKSPSPKTAPPESSQGSPDTATDSMFSKRQEKSPAKNPNAPCVVATRDILKGQTLTAADLKFTGFDSATEIAELRERLIGIKAPTALEKGSAIPNEVIRKQ